MEPQRPQARGRSFMSSRTGGTAPRRLTRIRGKFAYVWHQSAPWPLERLHAAGGEKTATLQSADDFRRALAPINVGVAMPGGCQLMSVGVQAALDAGLSDFSADAQDALL